MFTICTALLPNSSLLTHLANPMYSYYVNLKRYNESLVRRGEILLDFDVVDNWNYDLENMNENKKGRNRVSFIKLSNILNNFEIKKKYY